VKINTMGVCKPRSAAAPG